MLRAAHVLGISALAFAVALVAERDAEACGGCFHPPSQTASDINDERMLLAVSTQQTTLYDQLRYSGTPSDFAWVLPIHGTVQVGLSADVLFDAVDTLTATQILAPNPQDCPCQNRGPTAGGGSSSSSSGGGPPGGVTVTKQENVGPYATVQLHPNTPDDPTAVTKWLTDNGYNIPADASTILGQYTKEGFDFLAMKLLPKQGVQAMRPVRVTSPGASLSLPLRSASIGTGASVGITLWVVADGRFEPQNFPVYRIQDKDLVWDWSTYSSNYTTLRVQNEANLGGKGWELESSITLNQQLITNVIESGGVVFPGGGSSTGGLPPSNASDDYLAVDPSGGNPGMTADEVRAADIATLFAGMTPPNVRVTRIRSDIKHSQMTSDLVLQASADQSEISNVRQATQQVNAPACPCGTTTSSSTGSSGAGSSSSTTSSGSTTSSSGGQANGAQPPVNVVGGGSASGCEAIPQPLGGGDLAIGALGLVGLALTRLAKKRRS